MLASRAIILCVAIIYICHARTQAEPLTPNRGTGNSAISYELSTCEEQLSKYRKFLLQAIISFEDVCDAYNAHPMGVSETPTLFRYYQPPEQRSEIWAFFKLLMAQFNDLEFMNVIRDAVIERCRIKSQLQRDEKRNSVVLGKKQRFHSWGGKRASLLSGSLIGGGSTGLGVAAGSGATTSATEDHNLYYY